MRSHDLVITDGALNQGATLGLDKDQIANMAEFSAPYTHPKANRRYDNYVLDIRENTVVGVWDEASMALTYSSEVLEWDCPLCDGEEPGTHCSACNSTGSLYMTEADYDYMTENNF